MSSLYKALSAGKSKPDQKEHKSKNKQRVLIITSRGVNYRHRHLISDLSSMMPHGRKESKIDSKSKLYQLNEIAELYNCNNVLYFEARKHMDLYMWLSKAPNGPTAKFHVQNMHTLEELNFTGNCLKGSRPILSFDKSFEDAAHTKLIKEMFIQTFGVPPLARKSKPFIDHVMTFSIVDGKVWVRNYQITESIKQKEANELGDESTKKGDEYETTLVEIGPRFVMTLITVLEGSFGGPVIYENREFVSPNFVRAQLKASEAKEAKGRSDAAIARKIKKRESVLAADPLADNILFR